MRLWPGTASSRIALDIQPYEIRWLQVSHRRRGLMVEDFGAIPWGDSDATHGESGYWQLLQMTLASWVETHNIKNLPVAIALPAANIINKRIYVAKELSAAAIANEIVGHIQHELPGLDEPVCVDYVAISARENPEQQEISYVATRERYLSQSVAAVNAAGLQVKIVDVDMHAWVRAANFAWRMRDTVAGLLIIEDDLTRFIVFKNNQVHLAQQWQIENSETWGARFKQCLQLYASANRECDIQKILSVSATAEIDHDIKQIIVEECGLDIEIIQPLRALALAPMLIRDDLEAISSRLLLACGLAIREWPKW